MSEEAAEDDTGVEQIARVVAELANGLHAYAVSARLRSGREIVGPVTAFSARRREKKGEISWSGKIMIKTEPGLLEIDLADLEAISPK
jgi:hypothetical protein